MYDHELKPIQKKHTNVTLVAKGCGDLPATRTDSGILSIWKCSSLKERIKFLFKGEISLHMMMQTHPPVSVCIGDIADESNKEK